MGFNVSVLSQADRDRLRDFIGEVIDLDAARPVIAEATATVIEHVHTVARCGHDPDRQSWAARCLVGLAEDGARAHVARAIKAGETVFRKPNTTQVAPLTVPARVGVRATSAGKVAFQQPLWWELTWRDFDHWLRLQEQRLARHGEKIEAFRYVAQLHAKYPTSATPGEAVLLDGGDPRAIDLAA